jgi:hypothetical protein
VALVPVLRVVPVPVVVSPGQQAPAALLRAVVRPVVALPVPLGLVAVLQVLLAPVELLPVRVALVRLLHRVLVLALATQQPPEPVPQQQALERVVRPLALPWLAYAVLLPALPCRLVATGRTNTRPTFPF